ncbi:MAG: glycoside hydrolase family 3 C-terminal domain-containing protein [Actinomycetota bacterium]
MVNFTDVVAADGDERERLIMELVGEMTLREKLNEMAGNSSDLKLAVMAVAYGKWTFDSGGCRRLGIPPLRFTDGPRGVCMGHSTCFPVAMARGATWDPALVMRVGDAIGVEARAQGANFYGGVCINVPRHPGWGRCQETFGEDPYLLGVMGVASLSGAQRHLMACAKHFACNSIEESRFYVDVRVDERTLREVYLPHFKRCVDAGVASVMSAYNKVNGAYCGQNLHLLRGILKSDWGFDGLVMSDFVWGVRDGVEGVMAGLDMEMPRRWRFGRRLKRAVRHGIVPMDTIDDAVARIIRQKARFDDVGEPGRYGREKVACREHTDLACEVARRSMVLLKNEEGALPLDRDSIKHVAVFGKLADRPNIGDRGSSRVSPPFVVTPLQGIRDRARAAVQVLYDSGKDLHRARQLAVWAHASIVVAGLDYRQEGEYISKHWAGGDREHLGLSAEEVELIKAVADESERCVVVLEGGSAITVADWVDEVEAVLLAWYPGMEGGHAIAEVLFGDVNPGGKLPVTFPASESQLPPFDKKARTIDYGYYHGYRLFDKEGMTPSFPFGYGLSYTTFAYSDLRLSETEVAPSGRVEAAFDVTNTGGVAGDEVAQLYVSCRGTAADRPVKELKGFERVSLEPGETKRVSLTVDASELAYYDAGSSSWIVEACDYEVMVGGSSAEWDLRFKAPFRITPA